MSWAAVAAAVIVAGVSAAATTTVAIETQKREEKAQLKAQQDAQEEARKQAYMERKAQEFAAAEGKGVGTQGTVNLQVDKNVGDGTYKDTRSGVL